MRSFPCLSTFFRRGSQSPARPARTVLHLEQLESRLVPYSVSGNAWPNPQMTLRPHGPRTSSKTPWTQSGHRNRTWTICRNNGPLFLGRRGRGDGWAGHSCPAHPSIRPRPCRQLPRWAFQLPGPTTASEKPFQTALRAFRAATVRERLSQLLPNGRGSDSAALKQLLSQCLSQSGGSGAGGP